MKISDKQLLDKQLATCQVLGLTCDPPAEIALAVLNRADFARARKTAGFSRWTSYDDFAAERQALYFGYATAGVAAQPQRVGFAAFLAWSRLTGAPADIDGLDSFAAHWRWRLRRPGAPVLGRLGLSGPPGRDPVAVGGAQCVRVRRDVFIRWREGWAAPELAGRPDLDSYAARVVEYCLPSGG